jgi:pimeloyl-ACP methyl ester carboxylesterase
MTHLRSRSRKRSAATPRLRRLLAAALLFIPGSPTLAQAGGAPAAPVSEQALAEFARPHRLVDIGGGRRLNLFCTGEGSHTVLLEAGGSDWSAIWGLVQPLLEGDARVCSYDRAGLGYSDPAFIPRSPNAIVGDLHALIHAAGLTAPLVLVGHSLGGFNVKLYAALHPEDVAGLVLVDPSEERTAERTHSWLVNRMGRLGASRIELNDIDGLRFLIARYERCAATARQAPLDPTSITYRRCTDPVRPRLGPVIAAERLRLQVTEQHQAAQASEIANSVYGDDQADPIYRTLFSGRPFGDRPVVVLTHGQFDASDAADAADHAAMVRLHRQSAALSRRGIQRVVPGTSHNIEIDAPEAIVETVREVLRQLPARAAQASRPRVPEGQR